MTDPALLEPDDPVVQAAADHIRAGDVAALTALLAAHPDLAAARVRDVRGPSPTAARSLLHLATDWPAKLPRVAQTIAVLVAAGADPDARFDGPDSETPLHWAASSDDTDAIDALLAAGADLEARGAAIAGGTAMADATAFGQWEAARRLLEHGAATTLFEAAALGLADRVRAELEAGVEDPAWITHALWGACHGGRRATAELLLDAGADPDWRGWDDLTPLDAAQRAGATALVAWLRDRRARRA